MTPEEELEEIKHLLLSLNFETAKEQQISYEIVNRIESRRLAQAKQEAYLECENLCEKYTLDHIKDPSPAQGFRCNASNDLRKAIRKLARGNHD